MRQLGTSRQMYMVATYGKAGVIGFITGTLLSGLFGLITGYLWPSVMDPREGVVRLLICAGVGVLIAVGIIAARDAARRREHRLFTDRGH